MSASISANRASVGSQRTIPRASGVTNGRLYDRSADERGPRSGRGEEAKPVSIVGRNAESQGFRRESPSLESRSIDEKCSDPKTASKNKPPYSVEKPRTAQIDLLA